MTRAQAYARAAALEALGRRMFADPSLSASGKMACATCHDPKRAFGPPNALDVQLGGKDMTQPGLRAVPSLTYLQVVPQFTEHYYESDDEGDASVDNGPTGGLTWDGRADRGRDQARIPLLSPFEMANDDEAAVVAKIRRASYVGEFARIYGADLFKDDARTFAAAIEALEVFEQSEREFYPYSSKYDAYLAGRAKLTAQEARGLALFDDEDKGNCASCHRSAVDNDGTPPQFTDYGLIAIGLPRNPNIAANADSKYFDLGACGPLRTDLADRTEYCGLFRTPSLRNVALRKTFYHNGAEHDLRKAIEFYVERDYQAGELVSAKGRRHGRQVQRPAGALLGQHQSGAAFRWQARRCAGAIANGNRRHRRLPQHLDRRLQAGALMSGMMFLCRGLAQWLYPAAFSCKVA